ncbi:glycosyltransferase [Winogradskyella luteola]|uniref:Glycosyltransferase n=1 Tax=Winogradskyella luteola TaxID=2828330 RepID=A0A9X1JM41_9FLAO|nr:glycosyltransferase [Winogradskyella luteola]MBV7268045.1 glycosyltransferase [Winogradskyella luteola]
MKLSILIPMYNVEDHIDNCLNSVINQDIPTEDYEIIIINDGSTDSSYKIAKRYADKYNNIRLYSHENIGLYATRNKLLELATGKYIYNLDSDDYIVHNSFGKVINTALENDIDVLGFDHISTPKKDMHASTKTNQKLDIKVESGNDFLVNNAYHANTVWWYIIKREFMNKHALRFDENNPLGDGPFTLRLLHMAERMLYLPLDIHRYVIVPTSIMNSNERKHLTKMIDNYMEIFDRYNLLASDIAKKNNPKLTGVINRVEHWRDVNVYVMFYTLIKSGIPINEINEILRKLKAIGAYPIRNFIGERYSSLKHRVLIYIFNHKFLFYTILFPCRLLYRLRLLNF